MKVKAPDKATIDFFTHPRQLGNWGLGLSMAAAWFGATSTKAIMDAYWKDGMSALWMIAIPSLLTLLLVTLGVGKRIQALPYMTQPQAVESAFGKRGRFFLACVIIVASTTTVASQLVASRQLLNALLGAWGTPVLLGLYGIVIAYSLWGGFFAVAFTDTLQCVLMLIALGSLAGFVTVQAFAHPTVFQDVWQAVPTEYWSLWKDPFSSIALTLVFALAWMIAPEIWQRMKACHSSQQAQAVGGIALGMIFILCLMVAWVGFSAQGVFHVFHFTPQGESNVFLWMTRLLPSLAWQGLILLGFLSAVTSTMDSAMSVASQSFVVDLVQRFIWPQATWASLRWVNTLFLPVQGIISVLIAFRFNNIIKVLWLSADIYASVMLIPVLAILLTKNPHKKAGQAAMTAGAFCVLLTMLKQYTSITCLPLNLLPEWPFSTLYSITLAALTYGLVLGASTWKAHYLLSKKVSTV
jgi:SSS family solute:Na+ symporter